MKKIFLALFTGLLLSSCMLNNGRYAAISTKPIPPHILTQQKQLLQNNASSVSSRHVVVFIPFSKAPTLEDAINQILDQYNGKYLANVSIDRAFGQMMFWYSYDSWRITADVVG